MSFWPAAETGGWMSNLVQYPCLYIRLYMGVFLVLWGFPCCRMWNNQRKSVGGSGHVGNWHGMVVVRMKLIRQIKWQWPLRGSGRIPFKNLVESLRKIEAWQATEVPWLGYVEGLHIGYTGGYWVQIQKVGKETYSIWMEWWVPILVFCHLLDSREIVCCWAAIDHSIYFSCQFLVSQVCGYQHTKVASWW
jgi:hypothetical protein